MYACLVWLAVGATAVGAVQRDVDLETVGAAITLGRTAFGDARARLHAAYRVGAASPPIDYVEIVTPFRRIVLAAQARAAVGGRSLAQREALDLLAAAPDRLDAYVEMTFHPLNTFVGVPAYDVELVAARGARVAPAALSRIPRTGPRLESLPPALPSLLTSPAIEGAALSGGTLAAQFDLQRLDPTGTYDLVVQDGKTEVGRIALPLARLR